MKCASAVLLLALCVVAAQAQSKDAPKTTDVAGALAKNGHKLAAAVLDIAGVTKHASNPKARATFLLPTDAAIETFLKDMGLTVDDLKKRPVLAKQLVAQHTLLGSNVREAEIFEKGDTRKAASLASKQFRGDDDLTFTRKDGKVTVTDPQGFTATVGKPIVLDDDKTVLPIDKVLMGNDYYTSFDAVCKHRGKRVSAFCDAVKAAGLTAALSPKDGLDATLFVPNNAAFTKATEKAKPSTEALAAILKYHVVPGARELPADWKAGSSAKTLDGKELKVTYARVPSKGTKRKFDWGRADVIPADGQAVPVLKPNVHVGKAVVHGIGSVLNPTAAAVTTEKAATKPAAKPAAAAAAPAAAAKTGSRKLLDFGWGAMAGPTAEQDAAQQAIQNAVSGDESVANAAQGAVLGGEELSIPGDYQQVMEGVEPW
jgi:uncharacterized surface protein with fasciclin (FAS1) repeats